MLTLDKIIYDAQRGGEPQAIRSRKIACVICHAHPGEKTPGMRTHMSVNNMPIQGKTPGMRTHLSVNK